MSKATAFSECLPDVTAAASAMLRKTRAEDIAEKTRSAELALLRCILTEVRNKYLTAYAGEVWTLCFNGTDKNYKVHYEYGCVTLTGELRARIADELQRRGFVVNVSDVFDTLDVVLDIDAMTNAPMEEA